jgi:cobyrinic acid a,c-diamide synthase
MAAPRLGARLVVAGTHSGVGKTTVATGLLAAFRQAGCRPAGAKVGPDFIDPGYHALACGRPPRNLDPWLCGPDAIAPLAARAARGSDVLIVEGVMGLFDGSVDGLPSSTADVAELLEAPVALVVDASAMSTSVAALVHGYATYRPALRLAGVVLNLVGSEGHEILLREALQPLDLPVLGVLRRDESLQWRDRHLGLVPVAEHSPGVIESITGLGERVRSSFDLAAVMAVARTAPDRVTPEVRLPRPGMPARVAIAAGAAFSFTYTDTLDALRAAGCEILSFDPLRDSALPLEADGVVIGGGFPEVYAEGLAANGPLLASLRDAVRRGLPMWAECGGLLLLCDSLDGHPMAGAIPARARMSGRLTLGYRTARTTVSTPLGAAGTVLRGHEFHYSVVDPPGDALVLSSRWGEAPEGWATDTMLATYVHYHPGGDPAPVGAFAAACALPHALRG